MDSVSDSLETLVATGIPGADLRDFVAALDPEWIDEALAATGKASMRRRKLPAEAAVRFVIFMGLFADRSIPAVIDHLDLALPNVRSLARSSVSKARYRLGAEPLAHLFGQLAGAWAQRDTDTYRGLGLFAVDGVCMRVPDSDENFEHFGKPGGRGGSSDAGYPQARGALLLNLRTRMLLDAKFGPYGDSEQSLAEELWPTLPDHSLVLLDRGFVNYETFAGLVEDGEERHFLVRMRADLRVVELEELDDGSVLAEMRPSRTLLSRVEGLPAAIRGRVVAYQHEGGKPSRIFTSLLDHEAHPAPTLVELYHERWEIELANDEIKTHMLERKECLRSKKPEGIMQEIWGVLVAYNLVRREMMLAADKASVPPRRISFRTALLELRNLLLLAAMTQSPGALPRHIKDLPRRLTSLVLPERRSERRYPRHVKIKMSNYKRNRGKRIPVSTKDQRAK